MEEKGFSVKKQHRCCYTGGRVVSSHLTFCNWFCCLNNGEISLVSLKTGEILFNIGVDASIGQVGAPLSKIVRNEASNDEIISFDLSLNDEYIVFSTMKKFVRIVKLTYKESQNNQDNFNIPINVSKQGSFKIDTDGNIRCVIFDNIGSNMIVCGSTKGEILIFNMDSFEITHKYIGAHSNKAITTLSFSSSDYILYSGDSSGDIRKWNLRFDRLVLLNETSRIQTSLSKCNTMENSVKRESKRKYFEKELLKAKAIEKKYNEKLFTNEHHSPIINVSCIGKNGHLMISLVMEEVCFCFALLCFVLFCFVLLLFVSSLHKQKYLILAPKKQILCLCFLLNMNQGFEDMGYA